MEMLRTIIVALIFAGITVCSYYFLSSSPFPWENQQESEGMMARNADRSGEDALPAPSLAPPAPQTFTQDGPFSPAPVPAEGEDEFSLPALNELPEAQTPSIPAVVPDAQALNQPQEQAPEQVPEELPTQVPVSSSPEVSAVAPVSSQTAPPLMAATEETQIPAPPVLDSDLPALDEMKAASPFDSSPAPMRARPDMQVGTSVNAGSTQALPPPVDDSTLDLPPAPPLDADLGPIPVLDSETDIPVPPSIPESPTLETPVQPTVSQVPVPANPAQTTDAQTMQLPENGSVSGRSANPLRGNSAPNPVSNPVSATSTPTGTAAMDSETAAVREYLNKAAEKIQNGEALEVLKELSKFYGNPRFSAEESALLVNLLVQAATQVIYSQQSLMEPPYTVKPGDTLEKIALEYQIPEDFVARVNGLQPGMPLQPGTRLKVIRGPFHAIVYLDRHEMLLTLNGLFASRFWIGIGGELTRRDGDFTFAQKSNQDPSFEFLRVAGVPGCADQVKIQVTTDPNAIGGTAPTGAILMSQTDVQSLTALLGPKSQLILRCHSPKPVVQQTASTPVPASVPAQASVPVQTPAPALESSMELPAVDSSPAPAVGSSAELPAALPSELPASLPDSVPAEVPTTGELPLELPATL